MKLPPGAQGRGNHKPVWILGDLLYRELVREDKVVVLASKEYSKAIEPS